MQMLETTVHPLSFASSSVAYRGINQSQFTEMQTARALSPRMPLRDTAEMITLFTPSRPISHVLAKKREHFVSFSLQIGTAIWYATSGGTSDGYLVKVALPADVDAVVEGGEAPAAYAGHDGTQWIDPRHIVFGAHLVEWSRFRSRAVVDQEVLLAGGRLAPIEVLRVTKAQCDHRFAPWAETGEKVTLL